MIFQTLSHLVSKILAIIFLKMNRFILENLIYELHKLAKKVQQLQKLKQLIILLSSGNS